jgi:hypothetical protein
MITRRLIGFLAGALVLLTLLGVASNSEQLEFADREPSVSSNSSTSRGSAAVEELTVETATEIDPPTRQAELPSWFLWTVGVAAGLGTLWFLSRQRFKLMLGRRRAAPAETSTRLTEEEQAETIADFADQLISEVELEQDPRIAIQRVYAAVETGLGARELRRKPAETPLKYLDRVFGRRKSAAPALGRLTDLFQVARFSSEPIGPDARTQAIEALRELRDEYRSIARRRVSR